MLLCGVSQECDQSVYAVLLHMRVISPEGEDCLPRPALSALSGPWEHVHYPVDCVERSLMATLGVVQQLSDFKGEGWRYSSVLERKCSM